MMTRKVWKVVGSWPSKGAKSPDPEYRSAWIPRHEKYSVRYIPDKWVRAPRLCARLGWGLMAFDSRAIAQHWMNRCTDVECALFEADAEELPNSRGGTVVYTSVPTLSRFFKKLELYVKKLELYGLEELEADLHTMKPGQNYPNFGETPIVSESRSEYGPRIVQCARLKLLGEPLATKGAGRL